MIEITQDREKCNIGSLADLFRSGWGIAPHRLFLYLSHRQKRIYTYGLQAIATTFAKQNIALG